MGTATEIIGTAILSLLTGARNKGIRFPKLRYSDADGRPIVLALSGSRSKFPGSVNVTDGGDFGMNTWYGAIRADGTWYASRDIDQGIYDALALLSSDPAAAGRIHGHRTGACCFCGRHLETKESVVAGYGPVCAEKYSLPWGATEGYEVSIPEAAAAAG